jgi:hypothetical protein
MLEIAKTEPGDRPGPAGGEFPRGEDRPVPQAHQQRHLDGFPLLGLHLAGKPDRRQQRAGLVDGDFRRLALDHLLFDAPHRRGRVWAAMAASASSLNRSNSRRSSAMARGMARLPAA